MLTMFACLGLLQSKSFTNVPYVTGGTKSQQLDVFLPDQPGTTPSPVIVYVHGGAWLGGDKSEGAMAKPYLAKGFVVVSINYRLSQEARYPAQIEDCKAAVRWVRAHAKEYHCDPNRIAAWGSSAGGHLVALLGTTGDVKTYDVGENLQFSSAVQAVVDYFGPTDLLRMSEKALPGFIDHSSKTAPEAMLIGGGAVQDNKEAATKANPIVYVSKKTPPFFIAHGDQDHLVAYHQSELLFEALQKATIKATLHPVPGADHGFMGATVAQQAELSQKTEQFLFDVFHVKH